MLPNTHEVWPEQTKNLHVAFVTNIYPKPSAPFQGVFLHRSVSQLSTQIAPFVIHIQSWKPSREVVIQRVWDGVPVLTLSLPQTMGGNRFHINAQCQATTGWFYIRNVLKQADLIHSLNLYSSGYVAGQWARRLNKPHISHAIGSDVNVFLRNFPSAQRFSWLDRVSLIVCNSDALKQNLLTYSKRALVTRTVHRGVDLEQFSPNGPIAGPQCDKPPLRFLFLGGVATSLEHKGGTLLMQAWAQIEAQMGESTLVMGGPNSDDRMFARWRNTLQFPERVFFVGALDPQNVPAFMRASDVVIIPSFHEGLPNVANEAQACGCSVLATCVGGLPESVVDGKTGKLIESNSPDALAKGIRWFFEQQDKLPEMSLRARENVANRFSWQRFADNILAIYRDALE